MVSRLETLHQREYRKAPIRVEAYEWDAEVTGGLVALKGRMKEPTRHGGGVRGAIREFSRQSRLRMLKMIAKVNWDQAGNGVFITLTFPDTSMPMAAASRNRVLAEFMRRTEKHLGRPVSGLWRCEWVERKSGIYRGKLLPHYHLILFGVRFIPYQEINLWWKEALHQDGIVMTDVDHLGNEQLHSIYIAKYCAKVSPISLSMSHISDFVGGRHWGYFRRSKLPLAETKYFSNIGLDTVHQLRSVAKECLPWYDMELDGGFCLIGKLGRELCDATLELLLDAEEENA